MPEKKMTAKEARAKYMREWRRKNPDKTASINQRYWEKRALKEAQQETKPQEV